MKTYYSVIFTLSLLLLPAFVSAQENLGENEVLEGSEQLEVATTSTTTVDVSPDQSDLATSTGTTTESEIETPVNPSERIEDLRNEIINRRNNLISNFRPTNEDLTRPNVQEAQSVQEEVIEEQMKVREEVQERVQEVQENAQEVREDVIDHVLETRLVNFSTTLERRFTAGFDRLIKIRDLVSSRIQKVEDQGINVDSAEALLATADVNLAQLDAEITSAIALIQALPEADNPRDHFARIKASVTEVKNGLRQVQGDLQAVVDELKVLIRAHAQSRSGENESDAETTE